MGESWDKKYLFNFHFMAHIIRFLTMPMSLSIVLTLFLVTNAILLTRRTILQFLVDKAILLKLGGFSHTGYTVSMALVYIYQLFATTRLKKVMESFTSLEKEHPCQDSGKRCRKWMHISFSQFCFILPAIYMLSGFIENVLYDVQCVKKAEVRNDTKDASILEMYHAIAFSHWIDIIPYHPVITLILFFLIKLGTWGWVYADAMAIVLCRAVEEKICRLGETVRCDLSELQGTKINSKQAKSGSLVVSRWDSLREEMVQLSDLVLEVQKYIGPLIMACYTENIYKAVVMLFTWTAPPGSAHVEQTEPEIIVFYNNFIVYATFEFLFRVSMVTYFAAQVNHVSLELLRTIQTCPNSFYTLSVKQIN